MAADRCHYLKVKGAFVFVPECDGGAAAGPQACTCMDRNEKIDYANRRVDAAIHRLRIIERYLRMKGMPTVEKMEEELDRDTNVRRQQEEWSKQLNGKGAKSTWPIAVYEKMRDKGTDG